MLLVALSVINRIQLRASLILLARVENWFVPDVMIRMAQRGFFSSALREKQPLVFAFAVIKSKI
jgi:hypothetical protein